MFSRRRLGQAARVLGRNREAAQGPTGTEPKRRRSFFKAASDRSPRFLRQACPGQRRGSTIRPSSTALEVRQLDRRAANVASEIGGGQQACQDGEDLLRLVLQQRALA